MGWILIPLHQALVFEFGECKLRLLLATASQCRDLQTAIGQPYNRWTGLCHTRFRPLKQGGSLSSLEHARTRPKKALELEL
jgi:hypothetical protein